MASQFMNKEKTSSIFRFLEYGIPVMICVSSAMIAQQFVFANPPLIHHAFICTAIFVLAAVIADKMGKTVIVKIGTGFAFFGMAIGFWEILILLIQPAFAIETCF